MVGIPPLLQGQSALVYETLRMISKRAVYIVLAIALTRVVSKAYQRGGESYASCVVESRFKEYTLSITR